MTEPPGSGQNVDGQNPLLIPVIHQFLFSIMSKRDLLSARVTCKDWNKLATQELLRRGTMVEINEPLNNVSIESFIATMNSSPLIPVTGVCFQVDVLNIPPVEIMKFLSFIAPWVKSLLIIFCVNPVHQDSVNCNTDLAIQFALEMLKTRLDFLALKSLYVDFLWVRDENEEDVEEIPIGLTMTMLRIVDILMRDLQSFTTSISYSHDQKIRSLCTTSLMSLLPSSLKKLGFSTVSSNVNYESLMRRSFQLEDFEEDSIPDCMEAFLTFIHSQRRTLKILTLFRMDEIYKDAYPRFPPLDFVTHLQIAAKASYTFDFLSAFPSLVELTMDRSPIEEDCHEMPSLDNLAAYSQHTQVKRLIVLPSVPEHLLSWVSIRLYAHIFPTLKELKFDFGGDLEQLAQLFQHFGSLEKLEMVWQSRPVEMDPGLESTLSGVPNSVIEGLKDLHIPDTLGFVARTKGVRTSFAVGISNLKKLRILEIIGSSHDYQSIFTNVVYQEGFSKMVELKEIYINEGSEVGESGEEVLDALRTIGKDIYRLKLDFLE